jgi:hypothetical protein
MDRLLAGYRRWQEKRHERRVARAEAANSLREEPSVTSTDKAGGSRGENVRGGGGGAW